jgi:hypothetical protein
MSIPSLPFPPRLHATRMGPGPGRIRVRLVRESPGVAASTNTANGKAPFAKPPGPEELAEGLLSGNRSMLARAITLVESNAPRHRAQADELIRLIYPHSGKSVRIGISGPPGVGKSTFIDAWGCRLVERGHRIAVLAIDPSSSINRGSILGDKTRMESPGAPSRGLHPPQPLQRSPGRGGAQDPRDHLPGGGRGFRRGGGGNRGGWAERDHGEIHDGPVPAPSTGRFRRRPPGHQEGDHGDRRPDRHHQGRRGQPPAGGSRARHPPRRGDGAPGLSPGAGSRPWSPAAP